MLQESSLKNRAAVFEKYCGSVFVAKVMMKAKKRQ
jgi:hypothetical protein